MSSSKKLAETLSLMPISRAPLYPPPILEISPLDQNNLQKKCENNKIFGSSYSDDDNNDDTEVENEEKYSQSSLHLI